MSDAILSERNALTQLVNEILIERDSLLSRINTLESALSDCANELTKHGWGDFHYGDQPQEASVVQVVEQARLLLGPKEEDAT